MVKAEGLPWRDVLPILRELAEELRAALDDGTLPRRLSLEQLWVQAEGGVQLVDLLEESGDGSSRKTHPSADEVGLAKVPVDSTDSSSTGDPEELRAIALLREVARLALEGRRRNVYRTGADGASGGMGIHDARKSRVGAGSSAGNARRIRAAVPERAALILDRLAGVRKPYSSLERIQAELDGGGLGSARDHPPEARTPPRDPGILPVPRAFSHVPPVVPSRFAPVRFRGTWRS